MVDAGAMSFIDVTSIRMLDELAESLADTGVTLALAQGVGQVRDLLRVGDAKGVRMYRTLGEAVADLAR